ncbi:hypothetical protein B484DRAFT_399789 [Ochromonadaceae sp. CCMP2298]|nr:hypothetical protein B484DRAFT_399789 [Ochromonadaceae sp. CCMP2298]
MCEMVRMCTVVAHSAAITFDASVDSWFFHIKTDGQVGEEVFPRDVGHSLWLKALVRYPGNIDLRNNNTGWTLLHLAAWCNSAPMVRLLVKRGCDLEVVVSFVLVVTGLNDQAQSSLSTAMHLACMFQNTEAIQQLASVGASLEARNYNNKTGLLCIPPRVGNLQLMASLGADLLADDGPDAENPLSPPVAKRRVVEMCLMYYTMPPPPDTNRLSRGELAASLQWCREHGMELSETHKRALLQFEEAGGQGGEMDGCILS